MRNEQLLLSLLLQLDGQAVFNKVWEKSAIAAVFGLIAIVTSVVAWLLWKELKAERKTHREDCASKDAALAAVNTLFQNEMAATRMSTQGLITKLQMIEAKTDMADIRIELKEATDALKNGLRAIGTALQVPSERLNID